MSYKPTAIFLCPWLVGLHVTLVVSNDFLPWFSCMSHLSYLSYFYLCLCSPTRLWGPWRHDFYLIFVSLFLVLLEKYFSCDFSVLLKSRLYQRTLDWNNRLFAQRRMSLTPLVTKLCLATVSIINSYFVHSEKSNACCQMPFPVLFHANIISRSVFS